MISHCEDKEELFPALVFPSVQNLCVRWDKGDVLTVKHLNTVNEEFESAAVVRSFGSGPARTVAFEVLKRNEPSGKGLRPVLCCRPTLNEALLSLEISEAFGAVRFVSVLRLTFRLSLTPLIEPIQQRVFNTLIQSGHRAGKAGARMAGCVSYNAAHPKRAVQFLSPSVIWETTSTQFQRCGKGNVRLSGQFDHLFMSDLNDLVCHFSFLRWIILRPLGIPSAYSTKFAAGRFDVDETLKGYIIKDGDMGYISTRTNKVCEGASSRMRISECFINNLHCLLREDTPAATYNGLRWIDLKSNVRHSPEIHLWAMEYPKQVITANNMRLIALAGSVHSKLMKKREGDKTQRSTHLYTACAVYALSIWVCHPNWGEHLLNMFIYILRSVELAKDATPEGLGVLVRDIISRIRKVRRYYNTFLIQGGFKHLRELLGSYVLIKVKISIFFEQWHKLSTDYISSHQRIRGEHTEDSGFIPRFRNGHDLGAIFGDSLILKDRRFDEKIIDLVIDTIVFGPDQTSLRKIKSEIHQFLNSSSQAGCNITACCTLRWVKTHPLSHHVLTLRDELLSEIEDIIGHILIEPRGCVCDNSPMLLQRVVCYHAIPFWEHAAPSCDLGAHLSMATNGGKPTKESLGQLCKTFLLDSRHRPDAVFKGKLFDLLTNILPAAGPFAGINQPPAEQLRRDDISKWSLMYCLYNNYKGSPNSIDKLSTSHLRQGRSWNMNPATCPNNTRVDRPRQRIVR
nr:hypothetical protein [Riboviria sp.]